VVLPLLLALAAAPALAQDAPADGVEAAPVGPRLPELAYRAPAVYPPAALEAGQEAVVPLRLEIDATGTVLDVEVLEPQGEGFDEAAVLAARSFRFTPALDAQGNAAPAVIGYNMVFEVAAAPVVSVEGVVKEAGIREPLSGLELTAVGPSDEVALATSDAAGAFSFAGLGDGTWTIAVQGPGLRTLTETVEVVAGKVVGLDLYVVRDERKDALESDFEIVVEAEAASAQITERRLTAEEIKYLPGTGGDVVRVVQNLPGVARAPLGIGQLIIRGTAPEDSRFFLDGSPVPNVFHFGGLTSVLNNDLIEEVAFLPGNFSVRYGRIVGGLVDIRVKPEMPERSRGNVSVDVYQATAFVEQKVGERSFLSFSGRRSYIDAVLSPLLSSGALTVQAPRYYDGQLRGYHQTKRGATWDALFYLSSDRFAFVGGEGDEEEVFASLSQQFQRGRVRRLAKLGNGWTQESVLAVGPNLDEFAFGDALQAEERRFEVALREEYAVALSPERNLAGSVGVDIQAGRDRLYYYEARLDESVEEAESNRFAPGLYGELQWRTGRLTLLPGLRGDALLYANGYRGAAIDPRLAARFVLTDSTTLKAAVGRFSSQPSLRQVAPESDGTPDLTFPWSLQSSLGVQQQLGGRVRADVTAFYNELYDLVVGREDRLRFFTGPPPVGPFDTDPYANDGIGMVCGVETQLKYDGPTAVGLITATFSHSERQDRPDEPEELFAYDQPVVINALWSQKLPRNWRLGGRFRYGSGNPYTPVVNRIYDMNQRSFLPVYGARSSDRLPPFTSVDIRIDKTYTYKKWKLETYLDLQNVTFAQNPEVISWTYDFGELDPITSNPPLPVFGFKGEW
jgi:TonB family protein